jgi:hypothetical protein
LKLPSAGLRGSNGKNISRIGNGAYLWTRSPASTDDEFDARKLDTQIIIIQASKMKRKYTAFTKAFKQQTLDLASQPNTCIARLARDLGESRVFSFHFGRLNYYNLSVQFIGEGL